MAASRHEEIERKYEVSPATVFPSLADVVGVARVGQPVEHELTAVYLDSEALVLASRGVTLRRRTGGDDEGWHLKLPAGADTRTEVRLPLEAGDEAVPDALLEPVRAWVRDRPLGPVARITTHRREYPLLDDGDLVVARVTDDQVRAERLQTTDRTAEGAVEEWREWEVELADGAADLLDAVESALLEAGAVRAAEASKLARTLGASVRPTRTSRTRRTDLPSHPDGGELLTALLAEQTARLLTRDGQVRADLPGSVHKMRIAARRLRSALATYRPLLAPGSLDSIRDELRWLGQALAGARDAQVLREHLDGVVDELPPELVLGPVTARIDLELVEAARRGRADGLDALSQARYFRLLDALDELVDDPPLTADAEGPVRGVVTRLVARDAKRLRREVRAARRSERGSAERDLALHEARKKAKRLRYAAESAVPVLGDRAQDYAERARAVQEALGVHQDAVVARRALRDYGVRAHLAGENGFTFGLLHALEARRADKAEHAFEEAWKRLPHKRVRHWLTT
jgi:CHAD domain-containing protein